MQCSSQVLSAGPFRRPRQSPKAEKIGASPTHSSNTLPSPVSLSTEICFGLRLAYPAGDGSAAILRSIPQRELTLRQQQPVIAGVLDQASARIHQPLLQAGLVRRAKKEPSDPLTSLRLALVANSVCPGQEKRTMHK